MLGYNNDWEKNIEPNAHLYPVQITGDLIEEGSRWT
jgi:hypothetical protein